MSEPRDLRDSTPRRTAGEPPASKKNYIKPAFQCEKVFETMALACGKLQTTGGGCRFNRKNS